MSARPPAASATIPVVEERSSTAAKNRRACG
jgi:hypothetical protein